MELNIADIGEKITNRTTEFLSTQVSNIGLNPDNLPMKLLSILGLFIVGYLVLKIANEGIKLALKIGIIVVVGFIILSIGASIL